jgi:hypothetical protein
VLFAVDAFVLNTKLFAPKMEGKPALLAHRGVAQTFPPDGIENDTCTASRIRTPEHEFLENTIPSMQAAQPALTSSNSTSTRRRTGSSPSFTTGPSIAARTERASHARSRSRS